MPTATKLPKTKKPAAAGSKANSAKTSSRITGKKSPATTTTTKSPKLVSTISQICAVLKKRREELGWSQQQLATKAGMQRSYVSDVEQGRRNISVANFCRLTTTLKMTGAQVFTEVGK